MGVFCREDVHEAWVYANPVYRCVCLTGGGWVGMAEINSEVTHQRSGKRKPKDWQSKLAQESRRLSAGIHS